MKPYDLPDARGHFGPYGGLFVAETLVQPLEDLLRAYESLRADAAFQEEFAEDLRLYVGRPSPLYPAKRLTQLRGGAVSISSARSNHTGAHKINNTIGQRWSRATWARSASSPRLVPASTAATAMVAARFFWHAVGVHGCRGTSSARRSPSIA